MYTFVPPVITSSLRHIPSPPNASFCPQRRPLRPAYRPTYRPRVRTNACASVAPSNHPPIHLMACDMDGTLLNDAKNIAPANITAITRLLLETDTLFVPATGKSRSGALRSLGSVAQLVLARHPAGCPGVFLQGLLVFGLDGSIVHEDTCDAAIANSTIALARELNVDLIAYSRDSILCERSTPFTDLLPSYHEPQPEVIGRWEDVIGKRPLNKFIFLASPEHINAIRPGVQERIGHLASLTQAQPDMLEVLPPNASKGDGARRLFQSLNVDPENVLAIGDAENDLELLGMVGYSCAVENALPSVKSVARYTDFDTNNNGGVAQAIERFLLPTPVASA